MSKIVNKFINEWSGSLNTRIRELREQQGLRQDTLANFVGSSQQTISRIENGKCVPPVDLIVNIAEYFKVTVDYILCLSDTKRNLEVQLKINREIDEFYELVSAYKDLNNENRETITILLKCLREVQKVGS